VVEVVVDVEVVKDAVVVANQMIIFKIEVVGVRLEPFSKELTI